MVTMNCAIAQVAREKWRPIGEYPKNLQNRPESPLFAEFIQQDSVSDAGRVGGFGVLKSHEPSVG